MKRYLPFIIIAVVLIGGVVTFLVLSRKGDDGESGGTFVTATPQTPATSDASAPPPASPTSTVGLAKPNVKVSSPVVLEEYGDYECPPCGLLYPELEKIEHEYGSQLRIVFRHFPLTKMHKNAMPAAQAAEAARNQAKFWEMHDLLYRNQTAWKDLADARPTFISFARGLGLNIDRFTRDLDSPEVAQRISSDMQRGNGVGVNGTPAIFIEGYMLRPEKMTPEGLRQGINVMLQRKANSEKKAS